MYKDILSKEELSALLTDDAPADARARESGLPPTHAKPAARHEDLEETIAYLQKSVHLLAKRLEQVEEELDHLRRMRNRANRESASGPSRAERHAGLPAGVISVGSTGASAASEALRSSGAEIRYVELGLPSGAASQGGEAGGASVGVLWSRGSAAISGMQARLGAADGAFAQTGNSAAHGAGSGAGGGPSADGPSEQKAAAATSFEPRSVRHSRKK
jgi:hypothetical protein